MMSVVKIDFWEQKGNNHFDPVHLNHNHTEHRTEEAYTPYEWRNSTEILTEAT